MRICFISHSAERYGAEFALLELIQGLTQLGVSCIVVVPKKGPLLHELDRLNVEWRIVSYSKWWSSRRRMLHHRVIRTLRNLLMAILLARNIARWRCDLLYTNTSSVSVGAFAAWLMGKPHIWHLHESSRKLGLEFDLGDKRALRVMDRLSTLIIAVSHAVASEHINVKSDKMRVVYQSVTLRNKLETAKHPNPLKKDFQCTIVGSLHPVKGQDEAISAISELVRRGIDAHLLVIGDGPKRFAATLYKKVEEYELRSHVKFTGYVENPLPYIQMTDVMLMCSKWEAFPRVTIEAMLAGKPLIGSARGGIVEQIQDGETGLLYQGGNYLELADKIQYLYENREERLRLGKAARRWAIDRFTQERYAKEVFDLLKNVLAKENCTANPPQFHKSQLNKN